MYKVLDSVNGVLKTFPTYENANNFRMFANRPDWRIIKNTNMKILKKIGQIIISVLLFIFGLPLFCLYGVSIGIWDLIEIILFYNSKRDEGSTLVR